MEIQVNQISGVYTVSIWNTAPQGQALVEGLVGTEIVYTNEPGATELNAGTLEVATLGVEPRLTVVTNANEIIIIDVMV